MPIDYSSLLIALVFSSFAILVAALASWTSVRKERYLVFSAIGIGLVMVAIVLMGLRNGHYVLETLLGPFTLLHAGVAFVYASTRLFVHKSNLQPAVLAGAASVLATDIPLLFGLLGLANFALNVGIAVVLFLCARESWNASEDPRRATIANAILYALSGLSFLAPAVPVFVTGEWVQYPEVATWPDTVNAIMTLVGITGIGAITLTLHFSRAARLHHFEANTDPLTGVLNRRALFERIGALARVPGLAVLLLDLDHFKQINDQLGHAQGDVTLRNFADVLRAHLGTDDLAARIGGEEFCVVLPGCDRRTAQEAAERIRRAFSELNMPSGREDVVATVSVGLATGGRNESFESMLSRADAALYKAKHAGRNRVRLAERRLVA